MTTLDTAVLLFGVLISALVSSGFLLMFYGHALLAQSRRASPQLKPGMRRLARLLGEEAT